MHKLQKALDGAFFSVFAGSNDTQPRCLHPAAKLFVIALVAVVMLLIVICAYRFYFFLSY